MSLKTEVVAKERWVSEGGKWNRDLLKDVPIVRWVRKGGKVSNEWQKFGPSVRWESLGRWLV